jgi:GNAT superfamily N-acetyltransferase
MSPEPTFRRYQATDREVCLDLFDANCPEFFAPNERADYVAFLETEGGAYQVCLLGDRVVGAYGLLPQGRNGLVIRWILITPKAQGQGLGSAIMQRVLAEVRGNGAAVLHMAASHRSAPFFARFGARETASTPHGWGPDMHRVDMELIP